MVQFPDEMFRIYLLLLTAANFMISYAVEIFLIPSITKRWYKSQFKRLQNRISKNLVDFNLRDLYKIEKSKKVSL